MGGTADKESRNAQSSPSPTGGTGLGPHKTWTVVLASLSVFMTALETLVVTTSLPVLRADLHPSLSNLEWTVNAYNLAFACFLLTGAALGDRFGRPVPLSEAGIASGTNSMLRELGGVLGVAVLASVFTRHGVYGSQRVFVAGFTQALWVAVDFSALGVVAALRSARRPSARDEATALPADLAVERAAA